MAGTRTGLVPPRHLYKVSEAAVALGVSPMTLYRRIKAGEVAVQNAGQRCTRITEEELGRLLQEAGVRASSPEAVVEPSEIEAGAA